LPLEPPPLPPGPGDGLGDGVGVGLVDGLVVGAVMLVEIPVRQLTVDPPPFPEPLHWLIVTVSNVVLVEPESTVHRTRCVPPPPLPEPLHWVTAAPAVFDDDGSQAVVGAVPPPVPDVLHWLTVVAVAVVAPVTLLMTSTVQSTVPPPPLPEPLHWSIDVTRSVEVAVDDVQAIVAGAFAAP
jgi:hypothetical protein